MNGEVGGNEIDLDDDDDLDLDTDTEDTIVISEDAVDIDDDDDLSAEINIEKLVAKIEAGDGDIEKHKKEVRRRLDELAEQRRIEKELDNTFNFNLDDDI